MGIKAIFEPELDGRSVIVWDAGIGVRIVYWTDKQAEVAAEYLVQKANLYHQALSTNESEMMTTLVFYTRGCPDGEPKTAWQFASDFVENARKAGFSVVEGLSRDSKEFW